MPKRQRNIQELKQVVLEQAKKVNRMIRKGIVDTKEIARLNVASNMFVNLIKRSEKHE